MRVPRAYDTECNQYRIDFSIKKVSHREAFENPKQLGLLSRLYLCQRGGSHFERDRVKWVALAVERSQLVSASGACTACWADIA